ncbi:MAG: galactose mutarotase [Cyanobacteriota bacterium]
MALAFLTDPYEHWQFQHPGSGDLLRVVPERGGLVTGWRCADQELLYFDAERFRDPALSVRGGIPVLFPICGNLPAGQDTLPGATGPLAQHGFARDLPWRLEALPEADGIALELQDSAATLAAFPWLFQLRLELRLQPSALAITASIRHRLPAPDETAPVAGPMPFSLGLHPYLATSSLEGLRISGLPERCLDQRTMTPAATGDQLAQLATGVDLLAGPAAGVLLEDPGAARAFALELAPPFDLAVLWSDPPRPMVCLEPWTAPRGALVSGDRRLELGRGESLRLSCTYRLLPG